MSNSHGTNAPNLWTRLGAGPVHQRPVPDGKTMARTCTMGVPFRGAASMPITGNTSGIIPYSSKMNNGDEVPLTAPLLAGRLVRHARSFCTKIASDVATTKKLLKKARCVAGSLAIQYGFTWLGRPPADH